MSKQLGPDDWIAGALCTVLRGPFEPVHSPFPAGMFGDTTEQQVEHTHLQGRIFRIALYYPPFILLKPLDGIGDPPDIQRVGQYAMVPFGGVWAPKCVKLDTRQGVKLGRISEEEAAIYQELMCPPASTTTPAEMQSGFAALLKDLVKLETKHKDKKSDTPEQE